jgi:capsular polysaccharide biosynthesis protein
VNDPDQLITWSRGDGLPDRLWAGETAVDEERSAAALTGGLANLGFFTAALRRRARVWCLTAVVGLVIGAGLYLKFPPAYHATATVLLVYNGDVNPTTQVGNEASMAGSYPVAARVVREMKLPQSVASFQAAYTVTPVTDNVLTINVGAPSSTAAVQRASALATTFLQYRAQYARSQEQQQFAQLQQEYKAAQQRLQVLNAQYSQLPSPPSTAAQKAESNRLQTQITQQGQILQFVTSTELTTKTSTNAIAAGSYVLNPATALPRSNKKGPALYFVGGLFGGLVVGMGYVLVAALLSRRLRRRDDVAVALGAPVRLSVGPLRRRRWRLALPRRAAKREHDMKRVVMYLHGAVPGSSRGPASLAVVAVDDAQVVARAFVSLAASCAAEGKQVVVADLSGGAYLARLLGVSDPGIRNVSWNGAGLVLVLPQPEDVAPVGPVPGVASPAGPAQADPALVTACSSADLLLTFATLDPAFGGDHLGTWATNVVVLVTAGESSVEKVHSVGEMIRLAGTRLDSVVLIGADKSDESLGVPDPADQSALINPL